MARVDRFHFERALLARDVAVIAGVDEAGRGPLAGPVVAAAVALSLEWVRTGMPQPLRTLNDSKQLSEQHREDFFELLTCSHEVHYAVACVEADTIDRVNILQGTHRAMNQALAALRPAPDHVLVDGLRVPTIKFPQTPLIKGDSRSYSIAAASVIAKVTRDRLMREFDRLYPEYGFAEHKGYATERHLAAIASHGPCPIHRRSFSPFKAVNGELFPEFARA